MNPFTACHCVKLANSGAGVATFDFDRAFCPGLALTLRDFAIGFFLLLLGGQREPHAQHEQAT